MNTLPILNRAIANVRGHPLVNRLPPSNDPSERRRRAYWARMKPGTGARSVSAGDTQSMELRALPQTSIPQPGGGWTLATLRPPGAPPPPDPQAAMRAMGNLAQLIESYRQAFPSDQAGYPTPIVHALEPYFDDPERLRNDPERLRQIEQQLLRELAPYTTDNGQRISQRGYYASMALSNAVNLLHSFGRLREVTGYSRRDGYGSYFMFSANPYDPALRPYLGFDMVPFPTVTRPAAGAPSAKPGTPPPAFIPRPPVRGGPYQPPGPPAAYPPLRGGPAQLPGSPRTYPLPSGSRMQRNRAQPDRPVMQLLASAAGTLSP